MKKNYIIGFILLCLGVILIGLALVVKPTDETSGTDNVIKIDLNDLKNNSSYVKSKDASKKIRINFPITSKATYNMEIYSEFNRIYYDKDSNLEINAYLYGNDDTLEKIYDSFIKEQEDALKNQNISMKIEDITCNYLCKKIDLIENNKVIKEELYIFNKPSSMDIAIINYSIKNKEFSQEFIKTIIDNIKTDSNAKYTIGTISNGKLNFEFTETKEQKKIKFSLDSSTFSEVENGNNSYNVTRIKNNNTSDEIIIKMYSGKMTDNIISDVESFYNCSSSNKEMVKVHDKDIYKYTIDNKIIYAYLVNDDNVVLFEMNKNNSTSINDIANFTI